MAEWIMYAGTNGDCDFCDVGHFLYAQMHGHEPQQVRVVENEDGPYWGWLDNVPDAKPCMIYRREPLFRCCFTYGVDAEVKAGKGRVVRLAITAAEVSR